MELTTLKATSRVSGASRNVARLRKAGQVPAIYYGKGLESVSISVSAIELRKVLAPGKRYTLLDLEIDGKAGNPALVYSFQKDCITQAITHVDFLKIDETTPVTVRIPVVLSGIPVGVKNQGGIFSQENRYIKLSVVPGKIAANLSLDVSDFNAGTTFYAKDFKLGEATLVSPARTVIFTISTKSKALKQDAAAAAAAPVAAAPAAAPAATPAEKGDKSEKANKK